jgi:hypothetical protein
MRNFDECHVGTPMTDGTLHIDGERHATLAGMTWTLSVGEHTTRSDNAAEYGGAKYGGIEPALESGNIFVYSDPASGTEFGCDFDGWVDGENVFRYTGDGQVGDQELSGRNLTLLGHVDRLLRIRLFVADGISPGTKNTKSQRYVGEFHIDPALPFTVEDGPDKHGDDRKLLVFRLLPVGDVGEVFAATVQQTPVNAPITELISVEQVLVSTFTQTGSGEESIAERREGALVKSFMRHLEEQGHETARHKITIPESSHPLHTDIVDTTTGTLFEAKSSASRHNIRLAIGQLLDYRRRIEPRPDRLAVLVPTQPAPDMLGLLDELGISCTWKESANVFKSAPRGVGR